MKPEAALQIDQQKMRARMADAGLIKYYGRRHRRLVVTEPKTKALRLSDLPNACAIAARISSNPAMVDALKWAEKILRFIADETERGGTGK